MTDRKEALIALREKVRAGSVSQRDGSLYKLFGDDWLCAFDIIEWGSLEAAAILMRKTLPHSDGWYWSVSMARSGAGATVWHEPDKCVATFTAKANTPARALLLAILEALIAKEGGDT